jgi:hypothetical protein
MLCVIYDECPLKATNKNRLAFAFFSICHSSECQSFEFHYNEYQSAKYHFAG